ncbi:hypothetical protein ABIF61_003036 [Bradyrhizobium japonicum]
MYQSSQSINQVAAALARAQAELENPEKLLTATLPGLFPNGECHSFRYASLARGLEIVRKYSATIWVGRARRSGWRVSVAAR